MKAGLLRSAMFTRACAARLPGTTLTLGVTSRVRVAATPADVIAKLNSEVTKVLRNPAFIDRMRALGGEANPMTPQQFREFVTSESAAFKRIIEQANVTLPE